MIDGGEAGVSELKVVLRDLEGVQIATASLLIPTAEHLPAQNMHQMPLGRAFITAGLVFGTPGKRVHKAIGGCPNGF